MEKFAAANINKGDLLLVVRVELVDSVPAFWLQLLIQGSLALNQVHQVLQTVFGWEDAHLHRSHRRTLDRSAVTKFARIPSDVNVFADRRSSRIPARSEHCVALAGTCSTLANRT